MKNNLKNNLKKGLAAIAVVGICSAGAAVYNVGSRANEEMAKQYSPIPVEQGYFANFETGLEKVGEDYNEIWNWSWDKIFPMGTTLFTLQPSESKEINGIWPQINLNNSVDIEKHMQVPAGIYSVSGYLAPTDTSVAMDITIVPEPCSILILGLGSIFIRTKRS